MRIFLTGGTGTIGAPVLQSLISAGHDVLALARSPASAERLRAAGGAVLQGDIRAPQNWIGAVADCDTLVHTAATFDEDAVAAERRLVAALTALPAERASPLHVVYTGGVWLFPDSGGAPVAETAAFAPIPAFAHVANAIRSLLAQRHLAVSVVHPALVCGRDGGPLAEMRDAAESGQTFATRATPDTVWPLVDAGDLAALYLKVVEARRYRLQVIGCGISGVPVGSLVRLVSETLGLRLDLAQEEPPADLPPCQDVSAGYALSQAFSPERATRLTGWRPYHTDPAELVRALMPLCG
ncbi:NAD(P)H-binding protein [Stappia taiwanensis]|uniref:NAD(P)H-binding protein n=1 Tax=Stappia taiwanensis TaxID=992267 RepID=A0A838XUD0_9HYPH|nr:NAD-dependent epimerase/dehydratase family protein [Stappia taiwanensis]MBA4610664.1 NAD(P)H-binding protein [Stappia taiwanensis]